MLYSKISGGAFFFILSFSLLIQSCASINKTTYVDNFRDFSFQPPQEQGWTVQEYTSNAVTLFKEGDKEDESYTISIISIQDPKLSRYKTKAEWIEAVDKIRSRSAANISKRYKSIEKRNDPGSESDLCFYTYMAVEDHEAKRKSSRKDMMMTETAIQTCMHLLRPYTVLITFLSHQHYPSDKDPDIMGKAQGIFTALKFK